MFLYTRGVNKMIKVQHFESQRERINKDLISYSGEAEPASIRGDVLPTVIELAQRQTQVYLYNNVITLIWH